MWQLYLNIYFTVSLLKTCQLAIHEVTALLSYQSLLIQILKKVAISFQNLKKSRSF